MYTYKKSIVLIPILGFALSANAAPSLNTVSTQTSTDSTLTQSTTSKDLLDNISAKEIVNNVQYITNNTSNPEDNINNSTSNVTHVYNPTTGQDITDTYWLGYEVHIGKILTVECRIESGQEGQYRIEATVDKDGQPNTRKYDYNSKKYTAWFIGEFYGLTPTGISNIECNTPSEWYPDTVGRGLSAGSTPQLTKWPL